MRASLLLPTCIVLSAVIHVVMLTAVAIPRQRIARGETVTVDLVPANEVPTEVENEPQPSPPASEPSQTAEMPPPASKPSSAAPPPASEPHSQPEMSRPAQQKSRRPEAAASQQPVQKQQPTPPGQPDEPPARPTPSMPASGQIPPDTLADQAERLSAMLNLPGPGTDGSGAEAINKAKLTREEVDAFRAHLKSCWKVPRGVAANERLKMVIRLSLRQDGGLASDPVLIEGAAPSSQAALAKATAIRDEAMRTIRQCQPYSMLPAEKYREWRVLDVDFSPDQMSSG
jgi:hypothetical protein